MPTQKNSASWDLQLGFNLAFKRLMWIFSVALPARTMCPGVDSASENEYQGFLLG